MEPSPHRAVIPPVDESADRPLWSVMIPTFNCAQYLGQTLSSVLEQDPGPEAMQIEVVDDASSDDPFTVVENIAGSRVGFHRQPKNVGHVANFATCLTRARGQLVHLLHGDDWVRPGFYRKLGEALQTRPELGAAFCRAIYANTAGQWTGMGPLDVARAGVPPGGVAFFASEQRMMTPCMVVRRAVYEKLGGFDDRLACAEDWEMWVRIAAQYPIWFEPEPLAVYRMHDDSNTGRHVRSGEDSRYINKCIEMFSSYLPREVAATIVAGAKQTYARSALDIAYSLLKAGDWSGCAAVAREAFRMSPHPGTAFYATRLALRAAVN